MRPGVHSINSFCIVLQIRWQFRFALTSTLTKWYLTNFAYGTTSVLSWHMQNSVVIWWPIIKKKLTESEIYSEHELWTKHISSNGPQVTHQVLYWLSSLWISPWWRHQMETFPALLAFCAVNSPVSGEFHSQRPVTQGFDVCFDLRLNKRLSKQSGRYWLKTPLCLLWRHCNARIITILVQCSFYLTTLSRS